MTRSCSLPLPLTLSLVFAIVSGLHAPGGCAEIFAGVSGVYVDAAQDQNGNIHMVFSDGLYGSVYYMKYTGSGWIGPTYLPESSPQFQAFSTPDIAVGPDGRPQVVYGRKFGDWPNDLPLFYYAKANDVNGTSWTVQSIGSPPFRRNHARIAVDENNQPHIAYMLTNVTQPYVWIVMYRRPDGSEVIVDEGESLDKTMNPSIVYVNGMVHIAYYRLQASSATEGVGNIWRASGPPYGTLVKEPVSNLPMDYYAGNPTITVDGNGVPHVAYLVADWADVTDGYFEGIHCDGQLVDEYWTLVEEEECATNLGAAIAYGGSGNRYVGWSYTERGETYWKRNLEGRQVLVPYGCIAMCSGPAGVWYVRAAGCPGGIYLAQLEPGGPQNEDPVAQFTWSPEAGDITTVFSFDASGSYDPDGHIPLTYRWDWNGDGSFELTLVGIPTAQHQFTYPSTYPVRLRVVDTLGAWREVSHDVAVLNRSPVASFEYRVVGVDTVFFDASSSWDLEDGDDLAYRWDWDSDGVFDTRWILEPSVCEVLAEQDVYHVTLAVRDRLWASDDTTIVVELMAPEPATDLVATLTAFEGGWFVDLSWTPSPSPDLASQTVQRATSEGPWVDLASLGPGADSYRDTLVEPATYAYRILSSDGFYGSFSDSVVVEVVAGQGPSSLPAALSLAGVSPNPTSGSLVLRVGVPAPGSVHASLHDVSGRRVAETRIVVDSAGWHDLTWDLRDRASALVPGGYLLRIEGHGIRVSTPVVLVR